MRLASSTPWTTPEISVVVPLFDEEDNLPELYRRLVRTLAQTRCDFELVFVDDGSRDGTAQCLASWHAQDARVMVVSLSRNFGHQAAISAGIDHARGQAVVLMDGDLQDPPEVLPQFIEAWRQGGEVVYAVRTCRKEALGKRACYALFYRLLHAVSDLDIPLDSGDFCLMDRKVVEVLKRLPERNRFVRGLRAFVGFRQVGLAYERAARQAGQPKFAFRALVRLALDGLVGFSSAPLNLITWAGAACLLLALLGGLGLGAHLLCQGTPPGWWIVTTVLLACTGLQLVGMGILGEYIQRIFVETKGRPTYIVGTLKEPCLNTHWQEAIPQPKTV